MENAPGKKPSRSRVSVSVVADDDRISDLPDSVIHHILSFLPTREVVATSILSTRWKFLWTEVTTLDFILCRDDDDDDEEEEAAKVRKFVQFVNKVLIHIFTQRLQKFRLQWSQGYQMEPEYVSIWISYAISRSVRVLVLDLGYCNSVGIRLPGTLFRCATLEHLKIHAANFMLKVPSSVSLPKLEVLDLSHLSWESNKHISKLVSGCPVLHLLKIGMSPLCFILDYYMVSSPSLRHIKVSSSDRKWNLVFERDATTTTPLSICYDRVTRLDMTVECCSKGCVVNALSKSTKLRVLNITKVGCCKETHESCSSCPTKVPECLSSSLRKVSLVEFSGLEEELEMIKYILLHGEVLESFTLKAAADIKIKYQLLQNIASFPRSSRSCQLHFD